MVIWDEFKHVWNLYKKDKDFNLYADEIDSQIKALGFKFNLGSPVRNIGTTLKLMEQYKIKVGIGTSYGQCRASFMKEDWDNPIHPNVKSNEFGSFWDNQPHNEIEHVYAFAETVGEAVCKCLIYAHKAGVIEPSRVIVERSQLEYL